MLRHRQHEIIGAYCIARGQHHDRRVAADTAGMSERPHEADIGERHLARPVGGEGDADMRPDQLDGQSADDRHLELIEGALHEAAEGAGEGDLAGGGEAGRSGDHVLLGDTPFEITLGICLGEIFGIGRVLDVAVERDDARVGSAERFERQPIGAARR